MLQRLKKQGITILVSTPYMDEASLCDRVALVQSGKILSIDTPEQIVASFEKPLLAVKSDNMLQLLSLLKQCEWVEDAYPFGEFHHVVMKGEFKADLSAYLSSQLSAFEMVDTNPNIEDCFISLMKENDE